MSFDLYNTIRSIIREELEEVDIVPGRSGRAHDAASPCGSLYKIPISPSIPIKISQAKNSFHGSHSRWLRIWLLCLIAYKPYTQDQ